MKKFLIFLFIISFHSHAQDTIPASKSVIALDRMKVVYSRTYNPITVAVPANVKSFKVFGEGVSSTDVIGKYVIYPKTGDELDIYVQMIFNDDSIITEQHKYQIKELPIPFGTLKGEFATKGILNFTLEELKEAEIGVKYIDFQFPVKFNITQFTLKVSDFPSIVIVGNKFTNEVYELLKKAKINDTILISDIKCSIHIRPLPIVIKLTN